MPPSGCPGEGAELGTLPPLSPRDCCPGARNLPSRLEEASGPGCWVPILAPGSREGKPEGLGTQGRCQPVAPKKEAVLGFPEEGDVRSEMSLRERAQ